MRAGLRLLLCMCLCSCDSKILKQNSRWEKGAAHCPPWRPGLSADIGLKLGPQLPQPSGGGGAWRAGGGPVRRRGGAGTAARGPAPSGSATRPSPPFGSQFPSPSPRSALPQAVQLLEGVRPAPQRQFRREGPGCAYLYVTGSALCPSHSPVLPSSPRLPARTQAPQGTAQVNTRKVRA